MARLEKTKSDAGQATSDALDAADRPQDLDVQLPLDLAGYQEQLDAGEIDQASMAFNQLWTRPEHLNDPEWAAAMREWIDGLFASPGALGQARDQPKLFFDLIIASRAFILDVRFGPQAGFTDGWLSGNLARLTDPVAAAAVAELLVARAWTEPVMFDPQLRGFVRQKLGAGGLNNAENGLAARFLNMLWNDGDYDLICTLVTDGIDTAKPAYYGLDKVGHLDGAWSGYIQPLEHLLGPYLRLAGGDRSLTSPAPGGVDLDVEVAGFAKRAAILLGLSPQEQLELGRRKLAGATKILGALTAGKSAQVLTSYADVRKSKLVADFAMRPGTIWGFEHVRMPYVQAAHATSAGQQVVRMWEMWELVEILVAKVWYEPVMQDPHHYIKELIQRALKSLTERQQNDPAEYAGRNTPAFQAEFTRQCTEYVLALAEQAPRAKYNTAVARGHTIDAYLGSFGCNAGLWWAKKMRQPVYYCLDGVKDEDIVDYKTLKTSRINTFIERKGEPYIEGITLAEIREILTNWKDLGGTVFFYRNGEPVDKSLILDLKERMERADVKVKGARMAPPRDAFEEELTKLGLALPADATNATVMRVVAQAQLLRTAASAVSPKVLRRYLYTKGCQVLFDQGFLPQGFDTAYTTMLKTADPAQRRSLATALTARISDRSTGTVVVCDSLRGPLIEAIKRFG